LSPNRVFLGREVKLPIDLALGATPDAQEKPRSISEYANDFAERMHKDAVFVRQQLGRAAVRMKTRYDAKIK